jgi:hypothetical protein
MFSIQEEKIKKLKDGKLFSVFLWSAIKIAISTALIIYTDFGLYVVIGYIIYALENSTHNKHINNSELDLQLNILHQKIEDLNKK